VNHTRFPNEDHLPDWARRDNKVTKGDRVERIDEIDKLFFVRGSTSVSFNVMYRNGMNSTKR